MYVNNLVPIPNHFPSSKQKVIRNGYEVVYIHLRLLETKSIKFYSRFSSNLNIDKSPSVLYSVTLLPKPPGLLISPSRIWYPKSPKWPMGYYLILSVIIASLCMAVFRRRRRLAFHPDRLRTTVNQRFYRPRFFGSKMRVVHNRFKTVTVLKSVDT